MPSPLPNDPHLIRLREFVTTLPETAEVEAWGHPTFRAGKKMFASFGFHEGIPTISVKQTFSDQEVLLEDSHFFLPPYSGKQGWVGIWVEQVEWSLVEDLVERAYRLVALKRMLRALDA